MSVQEIEVLRQSVEALRIQKKEQENILVEIDQGLKIGNRHAIQEGINTIQDEINSVMNKISELEYELKQQEKNAQIEADHEERVAESGKQIAYIFDNLDFGVPTVELFVNYTEEKAKASYVYVRSALEAAVLEREKASLAKIKDLESKNAALESEKEQFNAKLETAKSEIASLKVDLAAAEMEKDDLRSKLKNAATALDEANKEIEQVKSWNNDLQIQIARGAKAVTEVIEVKDAREAYMEQRRKEEAAKTVIYNVRWKDSSHKEFLANKAEDDEEITLKYFEIQGDPDKLLQAGLPQSELKSGKYRVVTAEMAPSFRTEHLAKQESAAAEETKQVDSDSNGPVAMEEQPVTAEPFPTEAETAVTGLVTETPAVVGQTVTREEFEALKARVAIIEENQSIGSTYK